MDSERVLISRPLPRAKLRVLQATGFLAILLGVGGFVALLANETEVNDAIAALPFGPKDAGAAVLPLLGVPAFLFLLLLNRYSRLYGSCELVPGALLLRPLWGPGERGAVTTLAWSRVARLEERAETVRLELESGVIAHVPTVDPAEVKLLLDLHEEAQGAPAPPRFPLRSPRVALVGGCARTLWLSFFGFLTFALTLLGVARFAPTLATPSPAPQLLALLVFAPLFTWFCRARIPGMLGIGHDFPASHAELLPSGMFVGQGYVPYAGLRVFPLPDALALELPSGERYMIRVGAALPELLEALLPQVSVLSERPEWVVTDRARAYARATLFFLVLTALQWLLFVA